MSDSDDDWFEKDFDEIVLEVRKKKESASECVVDDSFPKGVPKFLMDADYGGNYELPKPVANQPQTSQQKSNSKMSKSDKGHLQTISFKKLSFISEMTPLNVFLEVTQSDCGFFECFKDDMKDDFVILMIKLLSKLCSLPLEEYKREFLNIFVSSETFFKALGGLFKRIFSDALPKNKKSVYQVNTYEVCAELLDVCRTVERFGLDNEFVLKCVKEMVVQLNKTGARFADIKKEADGLCSRLQDGVKVATKEIYPVIAELTENKDNDLKPNIVNGKYQSVQHYLSIQKPLLREDFLIPLRESIMELRASKTVSSGKVYRKVRILLKDTLNSKTRKGEMLVVDLKPDQREAQLSNQSNSHDANWVNPKKLMYGSLLCFTTSLEFDNLILAVVSNRDIETIQKGYIQIEIVKMYNIGKIFNVDLIMLESEVFFEPYHHVYRVLNSLDEHNFPMRDYVLGVVQKSRPPDYLSTANPQSYEYKKHRYNPLDRSSYPSDAILGLDKSQTAAFHHALSNKFTLIQGPPGTGKTHIGLKIVSTLLTNVDAQILVICYTNHALDQFLAGILKVTDDVVRLGNQSKNEALNKYNIKQMSDTSITDRRLKGCFYQAKNDYAKKFQEFERCQSDFDGTEGSYRRILSIQQELRQISRKLDELKQISDFNLIKDKRVVGMTTTCAAHCNLMLQMLKTPIVIIEEAAEIIETHIIASLTPSTQHLILIGDHQQLRPTTAVYKLSKKYKLDISLFERMVNNKLNCETLTTQHRMREEIADLLRPTFYKDFSDHESVQAHERVRGVKKSMFFVTHKWLESRVSGEEETSKRNLHEAQFLCALANYLLMQNYRPEDIVMLTTYNGQMIQLLNERKQNPNLQKVRVAVVDNFQGEESKIILLSLVRSNEENRIGYLGTANRICVALSRAREGLFVVGNMDFMAKNSSIWMEIKSKLVEKEAIGEVLPLECQRHRLVMEMRTAADFEQVQHGGCPERCDYTLPCGHCCGYMCHWRGFDHYCNYCSV